MNQHDYVKGAIAYYEDNGLHPGDGGRWEVAHYPRPRGEGDDTVDLMWEHHQVQGILQSEEEGRCCFWSGHANRFLKTTPFFEGFFDLWDLYDKWCGPNKGKSIFRDPETDETHLVTPEEAQERGWIGATTGRSTYRDPVSGVCQLLTAEEARERGWQSHVKGKGVYLDPETGGRRRMTAEEAEKIGWVSPNAGKAAFRDPGTGRTALLTREEATEKGWVHTRTGNATYTDPETGENAALTAEEAKHRGWHSVRKGKTLYKCPATGRTDLLTAEEATEKGWVGINAGKKHEKIECPYCGKEGGNNVMPHYHFDNCRHREGSWRWFEAELKAIDKERGWGK